MLNTQVDIQSEVLAEYASTRVTVAAEVGSIHISSASASIAKKVATLWRQLPREPYPSTLPPCARVPSDRHAQPSAEPADGSQLAPPPPPARGAAASSSPPSAVISPLICAPQQLYAVRSDLYIGVVLEITTPARGQEMGTRTGNFPVLPPLRACMRGQEIGILLKQPPTARRFQQGTVHA